MTSRSHLPRSTAWSAVVERHHPAAIVAAAVVMAVGVGTETEADAEDHGDDEDDAGGDAHPGKCLEQAAGFFLDRLGRHRCRRDRDRFGCAHRLGRRIGRRGCVSHTYEHASAAEVPIKN
ncbi:hypothetical protein A5733_20905 [Mycobacterium sp. NS-7484]|nr:hypothetical protein A5733_20905 [Mycobacterium sp. NS-7484]